MFGELRDVLFTQGFAEGGVGRLLHFEDPIRYLCFRHRVRLPDEHGRGLEQSELPKRDPSQVAEPDVCQSTELEVLVGGVDDCPECCSPFPAAARDMTFLVGRVCDAPAVADPGADLGRFVEQGERSLGLLVRQPGREEREGEGERAVDAGGTGNTYRFVNGRDRGVGSRLGDLDRGLRAL